MHILDKDGRSISRFFELLANATQQKNVLSRMEQEKGKGTVFYFKEASVLNWREEKGKDEEQMRCN